MKRALLLASAWLLLAVPEAHAKCCALTTPPAPTALQAGKEWVAQIEVYGDAEYWPDEAPTLIAWSDSTRKLVSVQAKQSAHRDVYHAEVVFPEPGTWSYTVTFGGFAGSASAPLRKVNVAPGERRLLPLAATSAVAALAALFVAGTLRRRR